MMKIRKKRKRKRKKRTTTFKLLSNPTPEIRPALA
jgi:hypothetical protein